METETSAYLTFSYIIRLAVNLHGTMLALKIFLMIFQVHTRTNLIRINVLGLKREDNQPVTQYIHICQTSVSRQWFLIGVSSGRSEASLAAQPDPVLRWLPSFHQDLGDKWDYSTLLEIKIFPQLYYSCREVCQLLTEGRLFPPATSVYSAVKTDSYDLTSWFESGVKPQSIKKQTHQYLV